MSSFSRHKSHPVDTSAERFRHVRSIGRRMPLLMMTMMARARLLLPCSIISVRNRRMRLVEEGCGSADRVAQRRRRSLVQVVVKSSGMAGEGRCGEIPMEAVKLQSILVNSEIIVNSTGSSLAL